MNVRLALSAAGAALAPALHVAAAQPGDAAAALRAAYPGVRVRADNGPVRQVFGAPMTSGRTPREAAAAWLARHAGVFADGAPDLRERWAITTTSGKTVLAYEQRIDGLPVPGSRARVLVVGPGNEVVYAAAAVSPHAGADLPVARVSAAEALAVLGAGDATRAVAQWDAPALVAYCGPDLLGAPAPAWRCTGRLADARSLVAYVEAVGGRVLAVHDLTVHARPDEPVSGTVRGWVLPGLEPYWGPSPTACPVQPVLSPLADAEVELVQVGQPGRVFGHTDRHGAFTLPADPGLPAVLEARLRGPSWETVHCSEAGFSCTPGVRLLVRSEPVRAPGGADLAFELPLTEPEREFAIAQMNAHAQVSLVHAHMAARGALPPRPPFLSVWVGHDFVPECNALYDLTLVGIRLPNAINGCPNMAYASIMTHEWGHYFAHAILGFSVETEGDRSFHEGFADSMSVLVHDSPIIGPGGGGVCGEYFRDLSAPRCVYPACPNSNGGRCRADRGLSGLYDRAEVMGALWWDLRHALGLEAARQLHADWSLLTLGPNPGPPACPSLAQAAGPGTLVEVAVAADGDGNLGNGVPMGPEICSAFAANGITPDPGSNICDQQDTGDMRWHTLDAGGGTVSGGGFAMSGTVGQPDAGAVGAGGLAMVSGYWALGPVGGPAPCSADCDTTTGPRVLDIFDFLCFQNRYAEGDPYACDCDVTTGPGECDIFDFLCFQNAYAAGCP